VTSQQVSTSGKDTRGRIELQAQDISESGFAGFDDGVGAMGGQPAQRGAGVLGVAQVPGAVQGVQTDRRAVIVLGIGAKVLAAISLPAMRHRDLDTKYPPLRATSGQRLPFPLARVSRTDGHGRTFPLDAIGGADVPVQLVLAGRAVAWTGSATEEASQSGIP
jgi:hypothetical protein